jgi:hypothetical protein
MLSFANIQRDIYSGQKYLLGVNKDIGTGVKTIRRRIRKKKIMEEMIIVNNDIWNF